jgi:hypothetical protein
MPAVVTALELGQELTQAEAGDGVQRLDLRRDQQLVRPYAASAMLLPWATWLSLADWTL